MMKKYLAALDRKLLEKMVLISLDKLDNANVIKVYPDDPDRTMLGLGIYENRQIMGNLLIAKYMNKRRIQDPKELYSDIAYHASWSLLMPVVSHIESLGGDDHEFLIFGNYVHLCDKEFVGASKIEAVWEAVVFWCEEHA